MSSNNEPMIQCDECLNWFHFTCLIADNSFGEDKWICSRCTSIKSIADPLDLADLASRKVVNAEKDEIASGLQNAAEALHPIKYLTDMVSPVIDPLTSPSSTANPKLQLTSIQSAIFLITSTLASFSSSSNPLPTSDTVHHLQECRQKLDKTLASHSVITAQYIDVAKDANKLFKTTPDLFSSLFASRLQALSDVATTIIEELSAHPATHSDDKSLQTHHTALMWTLKFIETINSILSSPAEKKGDISYAGIQRIDTAIRGSQSLIKSLTDMTKPPKAAKDQPEIAVSAAALASAGILPGLVLMTKTAKQLTRRGQGYAKSDVIISTEKGARKERFETVAVTAARSLVDLDRDKAQGVVVLVNHADTHATPAEMALMGLFAQMEANIKRKEEERVALTKIISKGQSYTKVGIPYLPYLPIPPYLPYLLFPVPVPLVPVEY